MSTAGIIKLGVFPTTTTTVESNKTKSNKIILKSIKTKKKGNKVDVEELLKKTYSLSTKNKSSISSTQSLTDSNSEKLTLFLSSNRLKIHNLEHDVMNDKDYADYSFLNNSSSGSILSSQRSWNSDDNQAFSSFNSSRTLTQRELVNQIQLHVLNNYNTPNNIPKIYDLLPIQLSWDAKISSKYNNNKLHPKINIIPCHQSTELILAKAGTILYTHLICIFYIHIFIHIIYCIYIYNIVYTYIIYI